MINRSVRYSALFSVCATMLFSLGCAEQKATMPQITLQDSVNQVEDLTEQILAAFETGDPKDADPPLHKIGYALTQMLKQAKAEAVSEEKLVALKSHINDLLNGFEGELHDFMHGGGVPEDYDVAPLATKLRTTMAELKSDLGMADSSPSEVAREAEKPVDESE